MKRMNRAFAELLLTFFCLSAAAAAQGTRAQAAQATINSVFCTHGGVGISAEKVPPYYAVAVVDIRLPAAASSMFRVKEFTLLSDPDLTAASMASVENIVQLEVVPPSRFDATYMTPEGTPITGPLPGGLTRLRIRVRLDHYPQTNSTPAFATHYRLTLTGLGAPLTVTGKGCTEWPT